MRKFIARGAVAETPDRLRTIKKGDTVWLGWTHEGGGWYQWQADMNSAKLFDDPENAGKAARTCPGPWFYQPSPESIEVVEIEYMPPQPASIKIVK